VETGLGLRTCLGLGLRTGTVQEHRPETSRPSQKSHKSALVVQPGISEISWGMEPWFEYVTDYRDSLGHRIPLYIPPGSVRPKDRAAYDDLSFRMTTVLGHLNVHEYERLEAEQNKLLVFQPLMMHSFKEAAAPYAFHVQILADFATVEELGKKMLAELK
jgi:hypothetical protein